MRTTQAIAESLTQAGAMRVTRVLLDSLVQQGLGRVNYAPLGLIRGGFHAAGLA